MAKATEVTLAAHFAEVRNPRVERTKLHGLLDILVIAICAVICGADSWVEMEAYGKAKQGWLKQFLALPTGFPPTIPLPGSSPGLIPRRSSGAF